MLNFIVGVISGFSLCVWYFIFDLKLNINSNISVNVIVAIATCIATAIHYDSVKRQKRDRIWENNKSILLDLTKALNAAINETKMQIDEMHQESTLAVQRRNQSRANIYDSLKEKIDECLNVYQSLMNKKLLLSIRELHNISNETTHQVHHDDLDVLSANETMLSAYKLLHSELLIFIAKVSGIKNT